MADFHPLRSLQDEIDKDLEWDALNQLATQLAASQPTTAPMPSLDHVSLRDYQHVYEPSDDTYLLIDALQYEIQQRVETNAFQHRTDPVICLEIGCGTGVPSVVFRTQWLQKSSQQQQQLLPPLLSFVTDVNPRALQITQQTFQQAAAAAAVDAQQQQANNQNIADVEAIRCDLATALLPRLQHQVTFLLFNPPYVPTSDEELVEAAAAAAAAAGASTVLGREWDDNCCNGRIAASWAGGVDGRRVVDRFVPQLAQLLETTDAAAAAYLVTVDENRPGQLAQQLRAQHGLRMRPLFRRRTRNEFLTVQKITRISNQEEERLDAGELGRGAPNA